VLPQDPLDLRILLSFSVDSPDAARFADRGDTATRPEAVEYAYRTDLPSVHAAAHETHAYALSAAGRPDEALAERTRAPELWERCGYARDVNRVRTLIMPETAGENT
jgi:hypothetical protein